MLARFERLMEEAMEGGLRRVFAARLQPIQLAKAAARAMEDSQVVGLRGVEVPNLYRLRLAEPDLERFADFRATLSRELVAYLDDYASDRGFLPVAAIRVEIAADPKVPSGLVRAEGRFVDIEPQRAGVLEQTLDETRRLRFEGLPAVERSAFEDQGAWLEDAAGTRYPLDPLDQVVRIGRSLDNDVVLADARVSRYHAHLRWDGKRWVLQDLGSTNGTQVAGKPLAAGRSAVLMPNIQMAFGGQPLTLRAAGQRGRG
jgi:hypothetical protein